MATRQKGGNRSLKNGSYSSKKEKKAGLGEIGIFMAIQPSYYFLYTPNECVLKKVFN